MVFRSLAILALAVLPTALAQISADFEGGWDQTTWPIYAPDCNQGGSVSLDTTTAHSGKNSMKVSSPGGYCGHIFFGTTKVPSGDVYVRVWLKATNALTSSHVSFITMPDSAQGTNKHLRIGGQNQILMFNRESDDATLPNLSPDGTASSKPLPVNTWTCFEYHLGTDGSIETWLDGNAIPGLTTASTNPHASQWRASTIKPKVTGVYFGWESYGSDTNTFWYDDISISSSRVGCSGGGVSSVSSASTVPATSSTTLRTTTATTPGTTLTTSPRVSTTTTRRTSTSTIALTTTRTTTASGAQQTKWGQCGGQGWTGPTSCVAGSTCTFSNDWYSQCL